MLTLHITETSLFLIYEREDNEVTYTDRFVFVRSTHTSKVHCCWTSHFPFNKLWCTFHIRCIFFIHFVAGELRNFAICGMKF